MKKVHLSNWFCLTGRKKLPNVCVCTRLLKYEICTLGKETIDEFAAQNCGNSVSDRHYENRINFIFAAGWITQTMNKFDFSSRVLRSAQKIFIARSDA